MMKKVPKRRFKGFLNAGDWEQRKLGECMNSFAYGLNAAAKGYDGMHKYIRITDIDDETHNFIQSNLASPDIDFNMDVSHYKLNVGDIVFARTGASVGKTYLYNPNDGDLYYAGFLIRGKVKEDCDAGFIYQNTLTKDYDSFIKITSQRSGQPGINSKEYATFRLNIPYKDEQEKISKVLNSLDELFTLHQRKLEKLQATKKALLYELFPIENSRRPKRRFKGFTGDWEQRKLGELGKARSGVGFPDKEQGGKIGIPFFKVSDMNLIGNENEMTVAKNYVTETQIKIHNWMPIDRVPAIFFAKVGAAVMLNRKRLCLVPFLLDNNTMAYSLDLTKWDTNFAKTLFETINLPSLVQVGALPSYNTGDIEALHLRLPSISEQVQIGLFFKYIDVLITLHQRKLEKLKNLKAAYLNEMFV